MSTEPERSPAKIAMISPTGNRTEVQPQNVEAFEKRGFKRATAEDLRPADIFLISPKYDEMLQVAPAEAAAFLSEGWTRAGEMVVVVRPNGSVLQARPKDAMTMVNGLKYTVETTEQSTRRVTGGR